MGNSKSTYRFRYHVFSDNTNYQLIAKRILYNSMRKNLYPNMKLERQHANTIKGSVVKPCIGQGRPGLKKKRSGPIS